MFPGMLLKYFLMLFSRERRRKKTVQFLLHDGTNLSISLLLTVGQCVRSHLPGFSYCSHPACLPEATGEWAADPITLQTAWSEHSLCDCLHEGTSDTQALPPHHSTKPVKHSHWLPVALIMRGLLPNARRDSLRRQTQAEVPHHTIIFPVHIIPPSLFKMTCYCLQLTSTPSCLSAALSSGNAQQLQGEQPFKTNRSLFTQSPEADLQNTEQRKSAGWRARRRISPCLQMTRQALWAQLKANEVLKLVL